MQTLTAVDITPPAQTLAGEIGKHTVHLKQADPSLSPALEMAHVQACQA